jgi:hypothetical protein
VIVAPHSLNISKNTLQRLPVVSAISTTQPALIPAARLSTMHFSRNIISCLLGLVLSPVLASFEREIVRRSTSHHRRSSHRLNDALLDVAIPLAEYEKQTGFTLNNRNLQQNGDDFGVLDSGDSYSFTGYSLKYMQCQAVQYFSENALQSGEASPMVTQDIVILRLCPQKSCLSSESKGCHYNYADFALTLSEYLGIMLKYSAYKRDANCEWCTTCIENDSQHRRLANDDAAANQAANGDDAAAGAGANQAAANGDDAASANQAVQGDDAAKGQHDDAAKADDYVAVDDKYVYKGSCANFDTYCTNYTTDCQQDDNSYLDFEGYLDYIDCTQVKYNGYPYYVRPRCDASSGSIKMAVYYDNYCAKTAGSDISVKNLGLGFKDGVFENYYSSQCTDCSESVSFVLHVMLDS